MDSLPSLNNYHDLLEKFEYDFTRYKSDNHIYILMDCMLTLNAIPDWIVNTSKNTHPQLYNLALLKKQIFEHTWVFDPTKLEVDIDHQIKLIRMICNHSKHYKKNNVIPIIIKQFGGTLPARFPIKFRDCIFIGEDNYDAEYLIDNVFKFWKDSIANLGL